MSNKVTEYGKDGENIANLLYRAYESKTDQIKIIADGFEIFCEVESVNLQNQTVRIKHIYHRFGSNKILHSLIRISSISTFSWLEDMAE